MKCKAKHWVKYNGVWHKAGEEFRVSPADADEMKAYGELTEEAEDNEPEDAEAQETARRGRKRKAEE